MRVEHHIVKADVVIHLDREDARELIDFFNGRSIGRPDSVTRLKELLERTLPPQAITGDPKNG